MNQPAAHDASPPQVAAEPPTQAAKASQKSPRQEAKKDEQYIKLARKFAQMISQGPQTTDAQSQHRQASASDTQPQSTAPLQDAPAPTTTQKPMASNLKEGIVTAQELAEKRPEPPTLPETVTAKRDAPGTGELSQCRDTKMPAEEPTEHPDTSIQEEPTDRNKGKPQEEASPTSSPTESSETIATGTAVNSSPEEPQASEYPSAVAEADLHMLKSMKKETKKKMAALATEMYHLQGHLDCLNKRIKTVESGREKATATPSVSPTPDIEMEVVD